jgi:hypothetical protein
LLVYGKVSLNNAGAIAGNSFHDTPSGHTIRSFFWNPQSGTIDLGTPGDESSFVLGIDDHSRILGYLDRDGGIPFVWQLGIGITELTSLIDLSDQYVRMQSVVDINSRGEILGSLLDRHGRAHIVVLTTVPEPTVWLTVVVGILGLVFKCLRLHMRNFATP